MKNPYYVYLLIDPRNNLPFYIGKGKGNRFKNHQKEFEKQLAYFSRAYNFPKRILSLKHKIFEELSELKLNYKSELIDDLTERDAFILEEALIAWFGRKICGNGILTNLLSGGKNGQLYFNEQVLLEIYQNTDLRQKVIEYPKTSTKWVAKSLYFYNANPTGYPFEELSINWLYRYHGCFQQFAVLVIDLLKTYDAVITPFYWVRKTNLTSINDDNVYIMNESLNFFDEKDVGGYQLKDFDEFVSDYNKLRK